MYSVPMFSVPRTLHPSTTECFGRGRRAESPRLSRRQPAAADWPRPAVWSRARESGSGTIVRVPAALCAGESSDQPGSWHPFNPGDDTTFGKIGMTAQKTAHERQPARRGAAAEPGAQPKGDKNGSAQQRSFVPFPFPLPLLRWHSQAAAAAASQSASQSVGQPVLSCLVSLCFPPAGMAAAQNPNGPSRCRRSRSTSWLPRTLHRIYTYGVISSPASHTTSSKSSKRKEAGVCPAAYIQTSVAQLVLALISARPEMRSSSRPGMDCERPYTKEPRALSSSRPATGPHAQSRLTRQGLRRVQILFNFAFFSRAPTWHATMSTYMYMYASKQPGLLSVSACRDWLTEFRRGMAFLQQSRWHGAISTAQRSGERKRAGAAVLFSPGCT